jgi:4-hydroxy-tetrahydrodipicolinate synthase
MPVPTNAKGVFTICPTPFDDALKVDTESIKSLVDFLVDTGVTGLAILGFLGELHKLNNTERRVVTDTFIRHTKGRVPVWVGVRAHGITGAIEQAQEAQDAGAAAVFAAPLDNASDALLFDYYKTVAEAVSIPVVIHDFPDSFGTEIRPEVVARLGKEGGVNMIKMEEPPVGQKISRIRELAGDDAMKIFGGLGGMFFLEELQRGAVEVLIEIYNRYASGDHAGAAAVFDRYCPLIRYEFQPKIGLALRKYIYQQRGAIRCNAIRSPGMRIDALTIKELEATVARVGLSTTARGRQVVKA